MAAFPCVSKVVCDCAEDQISRNFSAEAPDPFTRFSLRFYEGRPPLNSPPDDYVTPVGVGACFALTQQEADDCALRDVQQRVWAPWRSPGNGIFGNTAQTCLIPCANGAPAFEYTVPAGTFLAHSQAEADALAASYCRNRGTRIQECLLPPAVTTGEATDLTSTTATLNGTVNANGVPTIAYFEWGTTSAYGHVTAIGAVGDGIIPVAFSAPVTGLAVGTYHFRIVGTSSSGTSEGADKTFELVSDCSNPNVAIPSSLFVPVSEPALATGTFQQNWAAPAPLVLSATVPAGKGGIYQCRFRQDAQGIRCISAPPDSCIFAVGLGHYLWQVNGFDRTLTDIYSNWGNGSNPLGITVQAHAGFWSATAGYLIGVGGSVLWICNDTPPPAYDPDPGAVYNDAYFTGILDNVGFPSRYQKFCFERNLSVGDSVTFSLFQELYVPCSGGRPDMLNIGTGPTWDIVRVGTLLTMPTNLRVVNFATASKELLCPPALGGAGINWTGNISRSTYSSINGVDALAYQITDGSTALSAGDPAVVKLLKNFGAGVRITWTSVAWICEIRDRNNLLIWSGHKTKGATPIGKYETTGGCASLACLEWEEF